VHHLVDAADVQIGFLLPGERRVGQIFRSRGGTHRYRGILAVGRHRLVGGGDFALQVIGQGRIDDPAPDFLAHDSQLPDIVGIELIQSLVDALANTGLVEKLVESVGGSCEASGHLDPEIAQIADHFSQRRVFASDPGDIVHAELIQRHYIF
jgi:hypothetical protein